jgi:hypothetical protein
MPDAPSAVETATETSLDRPIQDRSIQDQPIPPLPNYTLSTVCPACGQETFKLACKVRCGRCGFVWDCSEL